MKKYDPAEVLAVRRKYNLTLAQAVAFVCTGAKVPGPDRIRSKELLDEVDRKIRSEGFTRETLNQIRTVTKEIKNGTVFFERYPQSVLQGLHKGTEALVSAAVICRGCPPTESESRPIYDTDDLVGEGLIQECRVEDWAKTSGYWINDPEKLLSGLCCVADKGTESQVFFVPERKKVYKLISLKHYNVLRLALDRIVIHNAIFPFTAMKVLGFGKNNGGEFVICVEQNYISGVKPTETERSEFMQSLGFNEAGEDYGMHLNYRTDDLYIGDVNEYNAIKSDGLIHVIDADCRINVQTLGCEGKFTINN